MTIGRSDEITPIKQKHFKEIIHTQVMITKNIINKHSSWASQTYHLFDINAGSGKDEVTRDDGSAMIALNEIRSSRLWAKVVLIEKDPKTYQRLEENIGQTDWPRNISIERYCNDHYEIVPQWYDRIKSNHFGCLYNDNNGIPSFDLLSEASKYFTRIDFLINCPASAIKRTRCCSKTHKHATFQEYIKSIAKEFWLIREPYTKWQWTFLIGTNWNAFPKFKNLGFHPIDSPEGMDIFNFLDKTKTELEEGQNEHQ